METARLVLGILGLAFGIGGVVIASVFDRLTGVIVLVVGAFLLILPLMTYRSDD